MYDKTHYNKKKNAYKLKNKTKQNKTEAQTRKQDQRKVPKHRPFIYSIDTVYLVYYVDLICSLYPLP